MIKKSQVALHVRVKFNKEFKPKCLGEKYLIKDSIIWIDSTLYSDVKGDYVHIKGYTEPEKGEGTFVNSGYAYLNELDLEFPIPIYT